MVGRTYERYFKSMVRNNLIQNFPIATSNVTNFHTMFRTNLAGVRGKTAQHNQDRLVMYYVAAPKDFLKLHNFLTLVSYAIFVNSTPFLITMSRGIKFVTV